jgi:hypothetical protein
MLRGDSEDLGEEFLHWAAKQRDGLPRETLGTTLEAVASSLVDLGQPPEQVWPYDDMRDDQAPGYQPPNSAHAAAAKRRLSAGTILQPVPDELIDALDRGMAVLLGIQLFGAFYTPPADGHIALPRQGAVALGGHALLIVGYNGASADTSGHFIVRNSWGSDWGLNGYAYLPYVYVNEHGMQAWGLA